MLETSGAGSIVFAYAETEETRASANDVLTGRLCGLQKWEPSLVRGDHDELLCCKSSLLGVFGALASNY